MAKPALKKTRTIPVSVPAPPPAPTTPDSLQASNRRVVKAMVFPINGVTAPERITIKKDADTSNGGATKELPQDDLLSSLTAEGKIIEPPFDLLVLAMLQENSTELQPAIEAMEINIDGFGHKIVNKAHMDEESEAAEDDPTQEAELVKFTNFFNGAALDESFVSLRRRTRKDLESIGNAYWEVIRNPITGTIQGFNHIPGYQMRLGRQDPDLTSYTRRRVELMVNGDRQLVTDTLQKRFRRFLQAKFGGISRNYASSHGYKLRWFKEYGDPRVMDNETGDWFDPDSAEAKKLPEARRASEIIHWRLYSPRTPYGLPRYIGNLITIFGDRAAAEINFVTLKNNNIPSMVVLVSNGQLTEGSLDRIEKFVSSQIQGSENYSRFLLLEGEGQLEGEDTGHVKIELKPLTEQQMRDQMFQEYQKNNSEKLRRAFRLPPIFLGISQDYTRATAEASRRLADEQVFKPERDEFDTKMNNILADMGCVWHSFVSNGPNVTDDEDLIKILMTAERTGGLTPRIAREIISDILGKPLPPINPEKLDPDIPFSIQMAEAAKNEAFTETGSPEVGSQVTALKSLSPVGVIKALILHRDSLEAQMEAEMVKGIMEGKDTKEP